MWLQAASMAQAEQQLQNHKQQPVVTAAAVAAAAEGPLAAEAPSSSMQLTATAYLLEGPRGFWPGHIG